MYAHIARTSQPTLSNLHQVEMLPEPTWYTFKRETEKFKENIKDCLKQEQKILHLYFFSFLQQEPIYEIEKMEMKLFIKLKIESKE